MRFIIRLFVRIFLLLIFKNFQSLFLRTKLNANYSQRKKKDSLS